jgi:hypothetical protein
VKDSVDYSPVTLLDETAGRADVTIEVVGAFLNANDRMQDAEAGADE